MGLFDEIKKLSKPYGEDDDYDDDAYDEDEEPRSRQRSGRSGRSSPVQMYDYEELGIGGGGSSVVSAPSPLDQRGKVVSMTGSAPAAGQNYQVVLVTPERFDAVTEIAESLRARNAVLLNLETASQDVARRLVDFLSGCAFALDGKIKKVANRAYLITPFNVDISGDLLDELQKSGMSFEGGASMPTPAT